MDILTARSNALMNLTLRLIEAASGSRQCKISGAIAPRADDPWYIVGFYLLDKCESNEQDNCVAAGGTKNVCRKLRKTASTHVFRIPPSACAFSVCVIGYSGKRALAVQKKYGGHAQYRTARLD